MLSLIVSFFNTLILAFSISTDDFFLSFSYALSDPEMTAGTKKRICRILSALQLVNFILGWIITDVLQLVFHPFVNAVPYLLLVVLCGVGIKLIIEGHILRAHGIKRIYDISARGIFLHGLVSSLDSYFLGISVAEDPVAEILVLGAIILVMTYLRCSSGIKLGKKVNGRIPYVSGIVSGIIIILIAVEIFLGMIL